MTRLAIVTNEPPPYRIPVFNRVGRMPGITLQVIFCTRREPNRHWDLPPFEFDHCFLRERVSTVKGRYIHNNPDVVLALRRFAPDVIVNDGLNPTQLYAFGYAWMRGIPHVPLTDGTLQSESRLTRAHRMVRRIVYSRSAAFLSASMGGQHLFESYGVAPERCFKSYLCIDNEAYQRTPDSDSPRFDFIFCSRIVPEKGPMFALEVARATARRLNRKVRILFAGSGDDEARVREAAARMADTVDAHFHGFAMQKELPGLYRSARIFLFPTHADVWGVVTNEACAAGLPVIVSPHAGVAGELVINGENGFVCTLEADLWAEHAAALLSRQEMWENFSRRSVAIVKKYTFDNAAQGVVDACRCALASGEHGKISEAA
ncbi:MAG TPA: glycosyltransferase family 4 protein [Noviherbaspirillum sp.]|uniref:glycosyltransferase family 4 protein n=1 Tax=Noviherbaspirillum sp. TaxID=1926288 RepID=UPI002D4DE2E3|nr:glycosyltransferase family 4 protein [Noviherbaspirillum sp.]HYD97608.1 glycosyltransferase family 4 protein [Noviherbaspirillum sp.]